MKKIIIIPAIALILQCTLIQARNIHTIDVKAGAAFNAFSYDGAVSKEKGIASGLSTAVRYSYFRDGLFGGYVQFGTGTLYASDVAFFGTANKADGNKYMYRFSNGSEYGCSLSPVLSVGAAWRLNLGNFDITPRIGLGIADLNCGKLAYETIARDGNGGPQYYSICPVRNFEKVNYLIDGPVYEVGTTALVFCSSLQLSLPVSRKLALFIEPAMDWAPATRFYEKSVISSKRLYEPDNWVEAVAYSGNDQWVIDRDSAKTTEIKARPAPFFSVDLGLRIQLN